MEALDCRKCEHYSYCDEACIYVEAIANGRTRQRERPIPDDILDRTLQRDYTAELAELAEDAEARAEERLELIRQIPDYRVRLIAASIWVGIPQADIAHIAHISQSQISRIYRGVR
jgi:hypothetical protein